MWHIVNFDRTIQHKKRVGLSVDCNRAWVDTWKMQISLKRKQKASVSIRCSLYGVSMAEPWYIIRSFIYHSTQCLSWRGICFIANLSRGPCTQQWLHQVDWQWRRACHTASSYILVQMVPGTEHIPTTIWLKGPIRSRTQCPNVGHVRTRLKLSKSISRSIFTQCRLYLAHRHFVSSSRSWHTFVTLWPNLHIWPQNWPRLDISVVAYGRGSMSHHTFIAKTQKAVLCGYTTQAMVIHKKYVVIRLVHLLLRKQPTTNTSRWLYVLVRGYSGYTSYTYHIASRERSHQMRSLKLWGCSPSRSDFIRQSMQPVCVDRHSRRH